MFHVQLLCRLLFLYEGKVVWQGMTHEFSTSTNPIVRQVSHWTFTSNTVGFIRDADHDYSGENDLSNTKSHLICTNYYFLGTVPFLSNQPRIIAMIHYCIRWIDVLVYLPINILHTELYSYSIYTTNRAFLHFNLQIYNHHILSLYRWLLLLKPILTQNLLYFRSWKSFGHLRCRDISKSLTITYKQTISLKIMSFDFWIPLN